MMILHMVINGKYFIFINFHWNLLDLKQLYVIGVHFKCLNYAWTHFCRHIGQCVDSNLLYIEIDINCSYTLHCARFSTNIKLCKMELFSKLILSIFQTSIFLTLIFYIWFKKKKLNLNSLGCMQIRKIAIFQLNAEGKLFAFRCDPQIQKTDLYFLVKFSIIIIIALKKFPQFDLQLQWFLNV